MVNIEKSGLNQDYVDALSASLLTLQTEVSRLRKDVDDLKSSQKPPEVGAADLNRLRELVVEKEEFLLKVIAGAQQQLQGRIDIVGEQLKLKVDEDAAEREMDRASISCRFESWNFLLLVFHLSSSGGASYCQCKKVLYGSGRAGRLRLMEKYVGHRLVARPGEENTFWTDRYKARNLSLHF